MPAAAPGTSPAPKTSVPPVKAPTGGTLTLTQLMQLAQAVGFEGEHIAEAAAIGMAESSGRSGVVNSIGCVGLMQINQPVWVKAHKEWTVSYLQVPTNNMAAAFSISNKGSNWHPWSTYQGPSYAKWLAKALKILPNLAKNVADGEKAVSDGVDKAVGLGPLQAAGGITGAIDSFTETIRKAGLTYLILLLALVLLVLGIIILLRRQAVPLVLDAATGGSGGTILKAVGKVAKS